MVPPLMTVALGLRVVARDENELVAPPLTTMASVVLLFATVVSISSGRGKTVASLLTTVALSFLLLTTVAA